MCWTLCLTNNYPLGKHIHILMSKSLQETRHQENVYPLGDFQLPQPRLLFLTYRTALGNACGNKEVTRKETASFLSPLEALSLMPEESSKHRQLDSWLGSISDTKLAYYPKDVMQALDSEGECQGSDSRNERERVKRVHSANSGDTSGLNEDFLACLFYVAGTILSYPHQVYSPGLYSAGEGSRGKKR